MQTTRVRFASAMLAAVVAAGTGAAAQLASRPAGDWIKVLEATDRLASLKTSEVVQHLKLQPGNVVADLGAGSGPFVVPFAQAVSAKGKVYAVEIDKGFFPYIDAKAKSAGVSNVVTVLGEFSDPKLPAADVDVAFLHDVLHHIENRPAYIKSLRRYLKPDARIAIIDYNPANSPHSDQKPLQIGKDEATALLGDAGFKPVDDIPLFSDKWFVVYGR